MIVLRRSRPRPPSIGIPCLFIKPMSTKSSSSDHGIDEEPATAACVENEALCPILGDDGAMVEAPGLPGRKDDLVSFSDCSSALSSAR
jgi:hypothetical protein